MPKFNDNSSVRMLRKFIQLNRRCCDWVERFMPNARTHTYRLYPKVVANCLRKSKARVALDMGGGKTCVWAAEFPEGWNGRIVALDISGEELAFNHDVNLRVVADLTRGVPFADASVGMITSRSVLEHLEDIEAFVREAARTIEEGGYFVHWIPNKFAPFALVNQMLPNALSKRLLYFLEPQSKGICGFPAVYDRCHPAALERLLRSYGFDIEELRPSYYQSQYFKFFLPAYLGSCLYETMLHFLGLRTFCAHILLVARKNARE